MEVQEKKRKLAMVLLAPHGQGEEEEDVGSLQVSLVQNAVPCNLYTTGVLTGGLAPEISALIISVQKKTKKGRREAGR